jgi:tubulin-folding cofactor B
MAALDMNTLKQYIRLEDHNQFQQLAQGTVQLLITHSNLIQTWPEIRFDLHTTIGAVKDRLYRHGGTGAGFQRLLLKQDGVTLCELGPDDRMLGYFGVQSGMEIHIKDMDPYSFSKNGGLEDTSQVEKYMMSEEDYEARPGTLRAYKKMMLEKDPYFTFLPENRREPKNNTPPGLDDIAPFEIGARCEVQPGSRRGVVAWKGENALIGNGAWLGVRLDEPLGKSDGTVGKKEKQVRLFECAANHGVFVRPDKCIVGDFPELDPLAELEDSEDEI